MLRQLLRDAKDLKNAIIFCNRKREVASFTSRCSAMASASRRFTAT